MVSGSESNGFHRNQSCGSLFFRRAMRRPITNPAIPRPNKARLLGSGICVPPPPSSFIGAEAQRMSEVSIYRQRTANCCSAQARETSRPVLEPDTTVYYFSLDDLTAGSRRQSGGAQSCVRFGHCMLSEMEYRGGENCAGMTFAYSVN